MCSIFNAKRYKEETENKYMFPGKRIISFPNFISKMFFKEPSVEDPRTAPWGTPLP